MRLTSKIVVLDLLNYASFGLKEWSIPLLSSNKERINWLKGFFSAEAYVGKDCIKIQTVNKKGMKQVSNLLNKLDIEHKEYFYSPLKKNYSKVYIISILKKSSRMRYLNKIGFFHEKKRDKLRETLSL